jgi:hypothetical protein
VTDLDLTIPEPFDSVVEQACAADRAFFEQHPDAVARVRRIVPGEFWPHRFADETKVRVVLVAAGVRLREPVGHALAPYDAAMAAVVEEHMSMLPAALDELRRRQ